MHEETVAIQLSKQNVEIFVPVNSLDEGSMLIAYIICNKKGGSEFTLKLGIYHKLVDNSLSILNCILSHLVH